MVVLVWRLFGRGAQGSACLDFSLSLRTGTLIRIGPGSYPGKGGVLSDHYLRKKKEKGGERSKKERRTAVAQQEMLTASLIYMQVQGEWGGAYSVSNLHVKCWPGQLMGMRHCSPHAALPPLHYTNTCLSFFVALKKGGGTALIISISTWNPYEPHKVCMWLFTLCRVCTATNPHRSICSVITRLWPEAAAFKAILHPLSLFCGIMIAMTTIT